MDRQLFVMCVTNQINPHISLREMRIMLETKISELQHYQTSLRFKLDTFRLFYAREAANVFDMDENSSISNEITSQLDTIQSVKELVQGILAHARILQSIYFRKLRLQGGPSALQ